MNMPQLFRKVLSKTEPLKDQEIMDLVKTKENVRAVLDLITSENNTECNDYYKRRIELELDKRNIPSKNFNYEVFKKIHLLMDIDAVESGISASMNNAIKLTILFGNVENALAYLEKFNQKNPYLSHIGYQACAFPLPASNKWDDEFWRKLAIKHMPNDQFLKVISHLDKLEDYLLNKRKEIEEEIRSEVVREYEIMLTKKFDELVNSGLYDLEKRNDFIEKKLKASEKKLDKDADKALDAIIRKKLNLMESSQIGPKERELIKQEKLKTEHIEQRVTLRKELENNLRDKLVKEFKTTVNPTDIKDYIAKRMESEKHLIDNQCANAISHVYSADGKISPEIDPMDLFKYAHKIAYKNADKNPEAAALFYEYGISEAGFDKYLEFVPKDNPENIPEVFIEGKEIGHPGYYLKKLDPADPLAGVLGKMTSCCQSMGGLGEVCAQHGICDPLGGFYVLYKKKYDKPSKDDIVVAQSWVWKGMTGRLMLDSIESQIDFKRHNEFVISDFYTYLGHKLVTEHDVKEVLVGGNKQAGTPNSIKIFSTKNLEKPIDYSGHRDSITEQLIVANANLPIVKIYASKRQTENPDLFEKIGKDVNMLSEEACKALLENNSDAIKKLIDEDKIDANLAYVYALKDSNNKLANYILEKGKFNYNTRNSNGDTALSAALKADSQQLEALIKNTDFNASNTNGEIAFTQALKEGHKEALQLFIKYHKEAIEKYVKELKNRDLLLQKGLQFPELINMLELKELFSNPAEFKPILQKNLDLVIKNMSLIKDNIKDNIIFENLFNSTMSICKSEHHKLPILFILENQTIVESDYKELIDMKTLNNEFNSLDPYKIYNIISKATKKNKVGLENSPLVAELFKNFITTPGSKQNEVVRYLLEYENAKGIEFIITQGLMGQEFVEIIDDIF